MKMKKTLIAAAVAGVCAAPMAAQADVFGEFIAGIENRNDDANAPFDGDTTVELDTAAIGAEGGEDLGNGLRVDAGVIFEDNGAGNVVRDELYGTLSGDFGSLTLGWGIDSTYYLHVQEPVDRGVIYDTYATAGDTSSQVIQYGFSNGPFSLNAEAVMDGSGNDPVNGDTEVADRFGIGASFDAGVVTVGAAHQATSRAASGAAEPSQTGVSVSGDVGPASIGAQYTSYDPDGPSGSPEPSSFDINGTMDFGGGLSGLLGYSMIDADTNNNVGDTDTFHAQLTQSLSSRTYVFGQLMSRTIDGVGPGGSDLDPRSLFVGMGHEF